MAAPGSPTSSCRAGRISWWRRWKADRPAGRRCWTRADCTRPRTPPRSPPTSCARWWTGCARPGAGRPQIRRCWWCSTPATTCTGPVRNQAVASRLRGRRSAMRVDEEVRGQLATRFEVLLPHLNERQQRLALACEARLLGHGGVAAVAAAAGVSPTTVRRGVSELDSGADPLPVGRSRRAGGGRRPVTAHDPELVAALLGLVEPNARGDPMSPLRWTTKSLRHLAGELTGRGHPVSAPTVGHLLRDSGFSLQGTAKTLEGK